MPATATEFDWIIEPFSRAIQHPSVLESLQADQAVLTAEFTGQGFILEASESALELWPCLGAKSVTFFWLRDPVSGNWISIAECLAARCSETLNGYQMQRDTPVEWSVNRWVTILCRATRDSLGLLSSASYSQKFQSIYTEPTPWHELEQEVLDSIRRQSTDVMRPHREQELRDACQRIMAELTP